ncbi:hypothetical protein [Streptomyces griseoluteus]|uniref:hypothetical protein n=1 Tax=Streptomyces griseoluteus TaxID=29306 RepID=UPI0038049919
MDVAGLHLLFDHSPADGPDRGTTVTGLRQQPLRLLLLAADLHPATFDLSRLFTVASAGATGAAARLSAWAIEPGRVGRGVGGPLRDRGQGLRSGQGRARGQGEDEGERVASALVRRGSGT